MSVLFNYYLRLFSIAFANELISDDITTDFDYISCNEYKFLDLINDNDLLDIDEEP